MVSQFLKYAIVGGVGVLLDLVSLVLLKETLGIPAYLAVTLNQCIVIGYGFYLQRKWTFKSTALAHGELVRYVLVFVLNYLIAIGVMYLFNERLGFDYRGVRIVNIGLSVSWNFFLYKFWVFSYSQERG